MADFEQVSSTTLSEEPKVLTSRGMGDAKDAEAEAKIIENETPAINGDPKQSPTEITDLSSPSVPEVPSPTEPVTSTTEDATEQQSEEAVTVEPTPNVLTHTEEPTAEKPAETTENFDVPVPDTENTVEVTHEAAPTEQPETEPITVVEASVPEPLVVEAPAPEPSFVGAPAPLPVHEDPLPVVAPVVEEPAVVSAPPEVSAVASVVTEESVVVHEDPVILAAVEPEIPKETTPVEEPIVVEPIAVPEPPKELAPVAEPTPAPEPIKVTEPVEEALPTLVPPPHAPTPPAPVSAQPLMQFSQEHWSSSLLASKDNSKASMDSENKDMTSDHSRFERDLLGGSDDDLQFEIQKNPFQGISLADNFSTGLSHFEDDSVAGRAAKMSESPTPDLVQYAHDGELQDISPFQHLEKAYDPVPSAPDSVKQPFSSSLQFSTAAAEEDEPGVPPGLPDILKSSPLNPDKVDSGSSEGSPDLSPVHRRGTESPNAPMSLSANNPFAFDSKISLLKEMAEETEARAAGKGKTEEDEGPEQSFGAFDLVKKAIDTDNMELPHPDPKDWKSSSPVAEKVADKFECLNFSSKKAREDSDSESPSADSLSPVLEAMAKNPASFQVESDKVTPKGKDQVEATEEVSEQEVSSEEFEFVERPPRGAIDEFLETLDSTKFSKTSDFGMDKEPVSCFEQEDLVTGMSSKTEDVSTTQSSYLLLTEPSGKSSPQRGKAGLELSDVQPSLFETPPQCYAGTTKKTTHKTCLKMPNLSIEAVADLLYWRDVKTSAVVFGANMLLLLSLTMCSIISVFSYLALALLSVTITFRIYKGILQAIQKSDEGHPFKLYLDKEVTLSEEMVHKYSDVALARINGVITELRRLFLVEDLVDSLKFAVFMWILTYVGAFFNGLTLLIMGLIAAFSCPIVYEKHQTQIDQYLAMVNNQIKDVVGKVQAKVPGMKKKAE